MNNDLKQIVDEAFVGSYEAFVGLIEDAVQSIRSETRKFGNFEIREKVVKIEPLGEAVVCGDLHGDLESLVDVLGGGKLLDRMTQSSDRYLVFLGDYGDRGPFSIEVYWAVLKLKLLFPEQVILLRGNHEGPKDLLPVPHDLPAQLQRRFGQQGHLVYAKLRVFFDCLYNAVIVKKRYLMVHGGLPANASIAKDLASGSEDDGKKESPLEELLWNDPNEGANETVPSLRGAGKLFSQEVTERVLTKLGVSILIRGHEPCDEGFKISHNGQILTLFSRKGTPYFNGHGAYLDMPLDLDPEDAYQLIPYIRKF